MRCLAAGLLFVLALPHARAFAAPDAAPLWPPDCTRDMPRDGLVLLDGSALAPADAQAAASAAPGGAAAPADALEVTLLRTSDGAPVTGALEAPDGRTGSLLRWRSHAPLHPNTEYKIEARQPAPAGAAQQSGLIGYFTTGDSFLAPLAFSGRPAVRLLARAPQPGAESQPEAILVRIALPALTGSLNQRALLVSAAWSDVASDERATGLRDRHAQAALPGETLGFELEARLQDVPTKRCLAIVARDDLDQELRLEPELCVQLPARSAAEPPSDEAPADASDQHFETRASQRTAGDATSASQTDAAAGGGCTVAPGDSSAGLGWLVVALPALLARRRRIFPG